MCMRRGQSKCPLCEYFFRTNKHRIILFRFPSSLTHSINAELNAYEEKHIKFDAQRFHTFMLNHQAMLFPAFQVQQGLQRQILGTAFWDKQTAKRQEQSAGEYISINQYVMGVSCSFIFPFFLL